MSQTVRNAARAEGSRALRGRPRGRLFVRWKSEALKGKQKYADWASSPINTPQLAAANLQHGGSMVLIYVRRTVFFTVRS